MSSIRGVGRPRVHRPEQWREVTLRWHRGEITAVAAMKLFGLPKSTFYRFLAEDNAGADILELGLLWDKACRVAEQQEALESIIVSTTNFFYNKKKHVHGTVVIRPDALQDSEQKYSLLMLQPDDFKAEIWRPYTLYPGSVDDPEVLRRMDQYKAFAWMGRRRRPVERYAAAEYQGRITDFCTKMNQFAATAYRSVGSRKIAIPFPGKLKNLPAPVLVESVEVVLQVQEPWRVTQNVIYLKVSYCNNTETIYTMSVDGQYGASPCSGAVIEPISTSLFEQFLECEDDILRHFTQRIRKMANDPFWLPECTEITEQTVFEQKLNERSDVRLNPRFFETYYW